ncbi:MAG: metal ABC transporter ATP-binding protein [Acidimicrobiia bacterium]|nr:metal ABC transporter ATP-binding protein [Acidimicrobiia bacterium]
MNPPSPSVAAESVSVSFGSRPALESLTFELARGSSTALVGPNGSGKTTLLRLLAGLIGPTSGSVSVTIDRPAFVVQRTNRRAWMPLTAREVLRMGRYASRGLVRRLDQHDHEVVEAAAARLDVADVVDRQFGELSGGQQQRVLVAQALAHDSDLLLLDEPITGLDIPSQDRILEIVAEETARGATVVMSTHHLEEAQRCSTVLLLATRLIAVGTPSEVLTADHLTAAYGDRVLSVADSSTPVVLDEHAHGH